MLRIKVNYTLFRILIHLHNSAFARSRSSLLTRVNIFSAFMSPSQTGDKKGVLLFKKNVLEKFEMKREYKRFINWGNHRQCLSFSIGMLFTFIYRRLWLDNFYKYKT